MTPEWQNGGHYWGWRMGRWEFMIQFSLLLCRFETFPTENFLISWITMGKDEINLILLIQVSVDAVVHIQIPSGMTAGPLVAGSPLPPVPNMGCLCWRERHSSVAPWCGVRRPGLLTPPSQLQLPVKLHCGSFSLSGQFYIFPLPPQGIISGAFSNNPPPCISRIHSLLPGVTQLLTAINTESENADERDLSASLMQILHFTVMKWHTKLLVQYQSLHQLIPRLKWWNPQFLMPTGESTTLF